MTEKTKTGTELLNAEIQRWVESGGTRYGMAAKIGISAPALSLLTRGLIPTESQRRKIAKAFPAVTVESWGKV